MTAPLNSYYNRKMRYRIGSLKTNDNGPTCEKSMIGGVEISDNSSYLFKIDGNGLNYI